MSAGGGGNEPSDTVSSATAAGEVEILLEAPGEASPDAKRILILAPTRNDAPLTASFLESAGLPAHVCGGMAELCTELSAGCGAVLLAEETLGTQSVNLLAEALSRQPSWSDVPIAIITGSGEAAQVRRPHLAAFGRAGNVTLIERPVRPGTLVTTFEAALRARQRQYQIRALLEQSDEGKRHLEFVLQAGGLGAWKLDLARGVMTCSETCKTNFGLEPGDDFSYAALLEMIHPDDRARVHQAVETAKSTGAEYHVQYRITTPSGEVRWIHARGRVSFDQRGNAIRIAGTTQNITERRSAEQALAEQASALRDADRRKDEFLAMLAHELRNPLASVSHAAALLRSADDPETHQWAAGVIERQTGQLGRLIDDLLDVSRITTGKIRLRPEIFDAAHVLERACDAARPLIADRQHKLKCEYERGVLWLDADPTRIEQIVLNLLTNAAKYTPAGGLIEVTARRVGNELLIAVRDNGMGVAPERLPEMFQLFAQGERSIARSEGGLGIGLTIVQKLAEMHGGRVEAQSDGLNRGSTFSIWLPAAAAPVAARGSSEAKTTTDGAGLRILLVDDNIDTAEGLARLLRRSGHQITLAHDGPEALRQADAISPDAVLLDIGLPGMDGFEVADRLRRGPHCSNLLIIAISGYAQEDDRRRGRDAGFDHHLAKPVDLDELGKLLSARGPRASPAVVA